MNLLRRRNLPASSHTPLTDKLGSLEQKIRKEIAIMKKCRHGHIVRLLEVIDDKLNERIYMGKHTRIYDCMQRQSLPCASLACFYELLCS